MTIAESQDHMGKVTDRICQGQCTILKVLSLAPAILVRVEGSRLRVMCAAMRCLNCELLRAHKRERR